MTAIQSHNLVSLYPVRFLRGQSYNHCIFLMYKILHTYEKFIASFLFKKSSYQKHQFCSDYIFFKTLNIIDWSNYGIIPVADPSWRKLLGVGKVEPSSLSSHFSQVY